MCLDDKDDLFNAKLTLQSYLHRLENIVIGRGEELVFRQRPDHVTVGRSETATTGATIAVDNADYISRFSTAQADIPMKVV